ncbi:hypothetical protein AF331_01150 [Rossellomorea marisflavi]|uniref:Uncharacterized protein n=1 Tax=Rossellomorea marisflavi TaxID=189381 RepID=A0A0M0GN30_9BACI|nr:hypothetical protein [Rossellomorea marisflavi]KON91178.1 hypothetical protein AF331_01150 [Rossellomorea marisflavi]MCM2589511.1 hypothetical protein [Rossellomorea marisflavi]
MSFSQEKKEQIVAGLNHKGANKPCERCGNESFELLDGYFRQDVQNDLHNVNLGGPNVPTIATACSNCGNLSFFAVGAILPADMTNE